MMYQSKLAVAIKVNGKVLREKEDAVFIPFGSEYTIYVKNMNSLRAKVRIEIDGADATENVSIVVPANDSVELERFIKNGNINAGQRFKFIERTAKIEDGPRGIKAEDGLIRIEFEFEREVPHVVCSSYHTLRSRPPFDSVIGDYNLYRSYSSNASASSSMGQSALLNDKGITVGGSISDQKFQMTSYFETDGVKHVMILKVFGAVNEVPVLVPVTVKTRTECPTCGTMNKFGSKFCVECGTGLSIV